MRPNHAVGTLFVIFRNLTEKNVSIFESKNFDYPEKPLKYKHIRRISD